VVLVIDTVAFASTPTRPKARQGPAKRRDELARVLGARNDDVLSMICEVSLLFNRQSHGPLGVKPELSKVEQETRLL
jgi:hypothetical protein